jgi:hypothetical protein
MEVVTQKSRHKWEDNNKIDLKGIEYGLNSTGS